MVILTISPASKPPSFARGLPLTVECNQDATVGEVKAMVAAKFPKFYPSRQRLSLKGAKGSLADNKMLSDVLGHSTELVIKDLGPQLSWRTVFLVEYGGPLLIHPLIYHFPKFWYGKEVQHSTLQKCVYAFVLLHFIKRELETIFVHRFSHGTMPFMNIFRNSAHYWLLSGLLLAFDIYRPKFSATSPYILGTIRSDERFLWICAGLWAFAELSNLRTHFTLRALRPANTRTRGIPYGYGFTYMSCPNYFFEVLSWAIISTMTGSLAGVLFTIVGGWTMAVWAAKKHRNYKKEFGDAYPRGRKAMFPFIF